MGCAGSTPKTQAPSIVPLTGFHDDFKLKRNELGSGNYGTVVLAQQRKGPQAGRLVAVKIVTKRSVQAAIDLEALFVEAEVMLRLRHPNVVHMDAFYEGTQNYYLVMELMKGGQLMEQIEKRIGGGAVDAVPYTETEARGIMKLLVEAVQYCHSQGVLHRDLKPENILLDTAGNIKIADFGFAKEIEPDADTGAQTMCGTPAYQAPEIMKRVQYGKEADVWSLGCILYLLLSGYIPFYAETVAELQQLVMGGKFYFDPIVWKDISSDAKDLIRKTLVVNPAKRYTTQQILRHPWMTAFSLPQKHLGATLERLKETNAARKRWGGAMNKVRGAVKMRLLVHAMEEAANGAANAAGAGAGAGTGTGSTTGDNDSTVAACGGDSVYRGSDTTGAAGGAAVPSASVSAAGSMSVGQRSADDEHEVRSMAEVTPTAAASTATTAAADTTATDAADIDVALPADVDEAAAAAAADAETAAK